MPVPSTKPSTFLVFPWGLLSIVIVLVLNLTLDDEWFTKNWSWIALVLIIPAAILENFKVGYSTMQIMFLKVVFSLLSFLLVGMAFGSALTGYHVEKFQKVSGIKTIELPWYVMLALGVLLLIQVAQLFSMLKAVKREFMQMDPDQ
jgi:magnesium-transporting ATPase (P-type)